MRNLNTLLVMGFLLMAFNTRAQSIHFVLDSVQTYKYTNNGADSIMLSKNMYSFKSNGLLLSNVRYYKNDKFGHTQGKMPYYSGYEAKYDKQGRRIESKLFNKLEGDTMIYKIITTVDYLDTMNILKTYRNNKNDSSLVTKDVVHFADTARLIILSDYEYTYNDSTEILVNKAIFFENGCRRDSLHNYICFGDSCVLTNRQITEYKGGQFYRQITYSGNSMSIFMATYLADTGRIIDKGSKVYGADSLTWANREYERYYPRKSILIRNVEPHFSGSGAFVNTHLLKGTDMTVTYLNADSQTTYVKRYGRATVSDPWQAYGADVYYYSKVLTAENTATQKLAIFPNPAKDIIKVNLAENEEIQEVVISDLQGRSVDRTLNPSNRLTVGNLQTGVYFLQVTTQKGLYTGKFIKE
ncbi:T9SS type A sorting domain-containing protein [bacterium]|nr:T9SS type A sorting domain-containing protein [bacterium]